MFQKISAPQVGPDELGYRMSALSRIVGGETR